jgi:hypothetical protein
MVDRELIELSQQLKQVEEKGFAQFKIEEEDLPYLISNLGTVRAQYDGNECGFVEYNYKSEGLYSASSTGELEFHTECTEFDEAPPKYLLLYCIHPCERGGVTKLLNLSSFFESLPEKDKNVVGNEAIEFGSTPGLLADKGFVQSSVYPIFSAKKNCFRFSKKCMNYESSDELVSIINKFDKFSEENFIGIKLEKGDVLIWNNHLLAHSRTSYVDKKRKLKRYWIND